MDKLIAKLAAASEGSRALDADVAETQGWSSDADDNWIGPGGAIASPHYTTSLDAALTLVPEGYLWLLGNTGLSDGRGAYRGDVYCHPRGGAIGVSNTPTLALCIAALKARQGMESDDG
jgi:hypothetical protein